MKPINDRINFKNPALAASLNQDTYNLGIMVNFLIDKINELNQEVQDTKKELRDTKKELEVLKLNHPTNSLENQIASAKKQAGQSARLPNIPIASKNHFER